MLPFAFVLLGKDFYEPIGLTLSDTRIQKYGIVSDDKFLAAIDTAKSAHLSKAGRTLPHLTLLYRYCSHRLLHFIEALIEAVLLPTVSKIVPAKRGTNNVFENLLATVKWILTPR
jgi:hypothetical protein